MEVDKTKPENRERDVSPKKRKDIQVSLGALSKVIDAMNTKMVQLESDSKEIGDYFEYNMSN